MKDKLIYYSVGPLLYCPADKKSIAGSIISQRFGTGYSLALCLEDTINDSFVAEAEAQLMLSLNSIYEALETQSFFLPKLFIRVRDANQILRLNEAIGDASELITGYIIPKFSLQNADAYLEKAAELNANSPHPKYLMPIFEDASIVDLRYRYDILYELKEKLKQAGDKVLNIRVGGNDLCHLFGFRRNSCESIHQIRPIANIFSDIISVYGSDYVISGPVWEYYSGHLWDAGLRNELKDDRLCGFTGKTVIHPNQISIVNEMYKVCQRDYDDALNILNWNTSNSSFVSGSAERERMNEYKTHRNWAEKIFFLAEAYGKSK